MGMKGGSDGDGRVGVKSSKSKLREVGDGIFIGGGRESSRDMGEKKRRRRREEGG